MATTFTVEAPVHRGLTRFKSAAVTKKAAQTFEAGDVITVTSGLATDFADAANAIGLCIAGQDAIEAEAPSGSPNYALVDCYLLDDVLSEMNLYGTHAAADIGAEFGVKANGGYPTVQKADTTYKRVRVLARLSGAVGDDNVRVLVRWLAANIL